MSLTLFVFDNKKWKSACTFHCKKLQERLDTGNTIYYNIILFKICDLSINGTFIGSCFMVINATFNNISVISWRSVLLVEETGVHGENHLKSQVIYKLYHILLYREYITDYIGSCKSNYHTIMTTTDPVRYW
jgi:hypothetical protein